MTALRALWSFIAGDSRLAPLGVAVAIVVALALVHVVPGAGPAIGAVFVAIVAAGLVAAVFEQSGETTPAALERRERTPVTARGRSI